jgi:hypothetical protein
MEVVLEHLRLCGALLCGDEHQRLVKIAEDGAQVVRALKGFAAFGSSRVAGVTEWLGLEDSEFEALVACLLRPPGVSTAKMMSSVQGTVHGVVTRK